MLTAMAVNNLPARKFTAKTEAEKPFKQDSSSSQSHLHLNSKVPFISHIKSTKFSISFHSNSLHNSLYFSLSSFSSWDSLLNCSGISWSWTMTTRIISCYLLFLCLVAQARDYPSPSVGYPCEDVNMYYADVARFVAEPLKRKLNSIIAPHHALSYKEVWNAIKVLDAADVENPDASLAIVEIYSQRIVSKSLAGKPEGWNREHLWPRSYGLVKGPSLTDLHNIYPADTNVNSSRGNKYFGECQASSLKCLKPAYKEAASDTETDKERWAPPKRVRGDVARAIMYMAICYGFHQSGGGGNLQLSDSPNIGNKEMGLLSTLLRWNEADPPSREEKLRNDRICKFYQHNRNPFVDHPEYAGFIWKQTSPTHESLKFPKGKQRSVNVITTK